MQTLLLIALLTAPAWTEQGPEITLNGSQKASLGSTVAAIWQGVSVAGVRQLHCVRDGEPLVTRCRPIELRAGTIEDYDNAELWVTTPDKYIGTPQAEPPDARGAFVRFVGETAGVVTWEWSAGYKTLSDPEQTVLASWVSLVWPSVAVGRVRKLKAERRSDGIVMAKVRHLRIGTRAQMLAALKAGKVRARNGDQ